MRCISFVIPAFTKQPKCTHGRWDDRCCETEEWQRRAGVDGLRRGPEQPFYHVLIDQRDWTKGGVTPNAMLAYVPEEMLVAPEVRRAWGRQQPGVKHPMHVLLCATSNASVNMHPVASTGLHGTVHGLGGQAC